MCYLCIFIYTIPRTDVIERTQLHEKETERLKKRRRKNQLNGIKKVCSENENAHFIYNRMEFGWHARKAF